MYQETGIFLDDSIMTNTFSQNQTNGWYTAMMRAWTVSQNETKLSVHVLNNLRKAFLISLRRVVVCCTRNYNSLQSERLASS